MAKGGLRLDEKAARTLQARAKAGWPRKGEASPPAAAASKRRGAAALLEQTFADQLREARLPPPIRQFCPFPDRAIRLDFAWPGRATDPILPGVAIELQGMAHRIKGRFKEDHHRHNALVLVGWTVYYVNGDMVRDGSALDLTTLALAGRCSRCGRFYPHTQEECHAS